MSPKRRVRRPKSNKKSNKKGRPSEDREPGPISVPRYSQPVPQVVSSAEKSPTDIPFATETSANKKGSSKRRKIAALLTGPAVITGIAGAVPQAVINLGEQVVHVVTNQRSSDRAPEPDLKHLIDLTATGRRGYIFGGEWENFENVSNADKGRAELLALEVVNLAFKNAGDENPSPAAKWRYTQWVLAGNMTPAQAMQILTEESPTPELENLTNLIREDHSIAGSQIDLSGWERASTDYVKYGLYQRYLASEHPEDNENS